MSRRSPFASTLAAMTLGLMTAVSVGAATTVQDATPVSTPTAGELVVPILAGDARTLGTATFTEGAAGVKVVVDLQGLTPGDHGLHLHDAGLCEPLVGDPYSTAGPHWNPDQMEHGAPNADPSHVGDLGNLTATEDGSATLEISSDRFTLSDGKNSVFDANGTAIMVHANPDDLTSQPGGESGGRFACGVVASPVAAATPVA